MQRGSAVVVVGVRKRRREAEKWRNDRRMIMGAGSVDRVCGAMNGRNETQNLVYCVV